MLWTGDDIKQFCNSTYRPIALIKKPKAKVAVFNQEEDISGNAIDIDEQNDASCDSPQELKNIDDEEPIQENQNAHFNPRMCILQLRLVGY